jgi:hypothetical protein
MTALNDLEEVLSADGSIAYLNAKAAEKVYTTAGTTEFGPDKAGRPVLLTRAFAVDYMASRYTLKPGSVKEPDSYLGAQVSKCYIDGADDPEKPRWAVGEVGYVKQAIADVETELVGKVDQCLPTRVTTPVSQGYRPDLDQSRELDAKRICELGRIDVLLVAVSMLSRYYVVSPASRRAQHLQQMFHIFAYLKHHKRSRMVFDDTEPVFNESSFKICDSSEFYPDAGEEAIPQDYSSHGTRERYCFVLFCGCGP